MLMILVAEAAVADPDDVADAGGCIAGLLLHLVHTGTQERKYSRVSSGLLHTCPWCCYWSCSADVRCWCDCYQMMWVLGCLLVAVTDVGCSQLGLKRVGWLISHFEVSQQCLLLLLITQCLWLISSSHSSSDWSGGWPNLQLMSLIHSSHLNYNWIVMWLFW